MINGTLDRARSAYRLVKEQGYSIRHACKVCNISRSFFKNYLAQQEAKALKSKPAKKVVISTKDRFEFPEMPEMKAPTIEYVDVELVEDDLENKKVNMEENKTMEQEVKEVSTQILKERYEREVKMAIGVSKYRYMKKLTQDEFAKKCGIGSSTLAQYESGAVAFYSDKRQVRMVMARMGLCEDEILVLADKNIQMPHRKTFDIVRDNVAKRLNYKPEGDDLALVGDYRNLFDEPINEPVAEPEQSTPVVKEPKPHTDDAIKYAIPLINEPMQICIAAGDLERLQEKVAAQEKLIARYEAIIDKLVHA